MPRTPLLLVLVAALAASGCSGLLAYRSGDTYYVGALDEDDPNRLATELTLESVAGWNSRAALSPRFGYVAIAKDELAHDGDVAVSVYDPAGRLRDRYDFATLDAMVRRASGISSRNWLFTSYIFVHAGWLSDHHLALAAEPMVPPRVESTPQYVQFVIDTRRDEVTDVRFYARAGTPPIATPSHPLHRRRGLGLSSGRVEVDGQPVSGLSRAVDWVEGLFLK